MKCKNLLQRIFVFLAVLSCASYSNGMGVLTSDFPCGAQNLPVNAACNFTEMDGNAWTASGVADPGGGCGQGNYDLDPDAWFTVIVPPSGSVIVTTGAGNIDDGVMMIYSGPCNALTLIDCNDDAPASTMPEISLTGQTPGATLWVRFVEWDYQLGNTTFEICASEPPASPPNDDPCGAIAMTVNPDENCVAVTSSTTSIATNSGLSTCGFWLGSADDDVWFSFVATSTAHNFDILNIVGATTDMEIEVFNGTCGAPVSQFCSSANSISMQGLTIGDTYYVSVWTWATGAVVNSFDACVTVDEPCLSAAGNNAICGAAEPFCTGDVLTYCNNTGVASAGSVDCLVTTPNPAYFYMNMSAPGDVTLEIEQVSDAGNLIDVDFILWGPFTSQGDACTQITANWNLNITDCSYSATSTEIAEIFGAQPGEWYMLMITNYSNQQGEYTFSQTGGAGETDCTIVTPCPADAGPDVTICVGDNTIIGANPVNAIEGNNYTWSTGANGIIDLTGGVQDNGQTNVTPAVTTTYTVTVDDGASCTATDQMIVNVEPLPNPGTPSAVTVCEGSGSGNLRALLTGEDAGGTFTDDNSTGGLTGNNFNPAGVAGGTYEFTYSVSGTLCGAQTATVTVTVVEITAVIAPVFNDCLLGNSFTFDGTGSSASSGGVTGYTWNYGNSSPLGSGATPTYSYPAAGNYTVGLTVTDGTCTNATTINIEVYTAPTVNLIPTNLTCAGADDGQIVATGAGGGGTYQYTWSGPGGFNGTNPSAGASDTEVNLVPGTYIVTVIDLNNCEGSATVTLAEPAAISVTASNTNPLCAGNLGTVSAAASGGDGGPYTYNWTGGLNPTGAIQAAGDGAFTVVASDGNCTVSDVVTITEPAALNLTVVNTSITCPGDNDGTATATGTGGTGTFLYTWNNGVGPGATVTGLTNISYTVTATDGNGCFTDAQTLIAAPTPITVTASSTPADCNGDANGGISASASGGEGSLTYAWDNGGGTNATNNTLPAGTYIVTVTDGNLCTNTATTTITEPTPVSVTIVNTSVTCNSGNNGTATATGAGGQGGFTYAWDGGAGTTPIATGLTATTYTVVATDGNGCTATAITTITEPTPVSVTIVNTSVTCNSGNNGTATATGAGGQGGFTYAWDGGAGTTPIATGLTATTYT
ncbi:PKD domain-containing protein, partial [bacterium]|nr:PKD domain-containing protein [bacterium]